MEDLVSEIANIGEREKARALKLKKVCTGVRVCLRVLRVLRVLREGRSLCLP